MKDLTYCEVREGSADYRAAVELRNRVLRDPLGLVFTDAERAEDLNSYHLACLREGHLVACLVLTPQSDSIIRMRQVAVREDMQGQGIGSAIVCYSEVFAMDHGFKGMMLHARDAVVPFYERLGYCTQGGIFIEVTIPHMAMVKILSS